MSDTPRPEVEEPNGPWAQSAKLSFRFLYLVVFVLAAGWSVSNFRQVPPDGRVVVLRFGSIVRQAGAGLLLAWPRPIEQLVELPAADRQLQFEVERLKSSGYAYLANDAVISSDPRENSGFLMTGDSGVVHLQATLFYQITDPNAYLVARDHIEPALDRLFTASAVSVCASRDIDTILVARPEQDSAGDGLASREKLRSDLMQAINQRLRQLADQGAGLGIVVSRVDVAAALPSTAKSAFDLVLRSAQEADQGIAMARTDAERTAQNAAQTSNQILTNAQAAAEETVTLAQTRTATLSALLPQLRGPSGKAIVSRLYYERIGKLLAKAQRVDSVDGKNGPHMILPGASR